MSYFEDIVSSVLLLVLSECSNWMSTHNSKAAISYFTSVRKEKICHSEDVHFPIQCLCWGSYFYLCESVEPLMENRNFNLKRERKKGKAKHKGKEKNRNRERKRNRKRNTKRKREKRKRKRENFKKRKKGKKRRKKDKKMKKEKTFLDETSRWEC